MGAPIVTIDRGVVAGSNPARTAGGMVKTDAGSTPTFLSTESLTFPGVSLISLGLVQVYERALDRSASTVELALMAATLGAIVILWGLLSRTNERGKWQNVVGQVLIGVLNTALLFGVMLGGTSG